MGAGRGCSRVLLTGAAGFVGSHVMRHLLVNTDWHVIAPVTFAHRGIPHRILSAAEGIDQAMDRLTVFYTDLASPIDRFSTQQIDRVDYIINVASESHVDRSITDPVRFTRNNIDLMLSVLEFARQARPKLFVQVSTDEVYGPAPDGHAHREWEPAIPSNPYAASKAAQEAIAIAYWRTYGVPVVLTNTMNMIGEMQDPEKYLPMVIARILRGERVTVHASPDGRIGSRFYLHARNLADAILFLIRRGEVATHAGGADRPDRWHVVGEREVTNLDLARMVADLMGRPLDYELVDFHTSRPGHDLRYALDGGKIAAAGWKAPVPFEDSVQRTVRWTLANEQWARL